MLEKTFLRLEGVILFYEIACKYWNEGYARCLIIFRDVYSVSVQCNIFMSMLLILHSMSI